LQRTAQKEKKIAILGAGGIGHLAAKVARILNYDVTVFSKSPHKKEYLT